MKAKKTIKSSLYIYANNHIPIRLLDIMIEFISGYNSSYGNQGKLGLLGIDEDTAESYECSHQQMLNYKLCLEVGTKHFVSRIKHFRIKHPGISIDDLYMTALTEWINSSFASKVWKVFKKCGGDIK